MVRFVLSRLFAVAPRIAKPILPVARVRLTAPNPTTSRLGQYQGLRLSSSSSAPSSPTPETPGIPPNASLSQKLKHLIKSYGWYALGVYLAVGAVDLGVAFLGVNVLGAEYVSQAVATVKGTVADMIHSKPAEPGLEEMDAARTTAAGQEGFYAMLVLAYGIHKTIFLPVRIGITAAFTPRLVHWLQRRGWAGGAGTRRAATEMRERLRNRLDRDHD